ncbi:MAG TPA: MFS transporter [Ktedonobacterales bacterium]|nr:MFS transporter [Ktedonobacterales bacterium]
MSPELPAPETTQTTEAPQRVGILTPFHYRNFTLLFVGQLVSFLGDQAYGIALPWTVLAVTGDARQMSTVLVAGAVPRVLLILIGGALADRISPRAIMLFADTTRVLVVGALGVFLLGGLPPLWAVAALAAAEGAASGLFSPCFGSITPAILPPNALAGGNGLIMVMNFATLVIGPLFGGIATAAQATAAFLADAGSFAVSALSLGAMRIPRTPRTAERKHLIREIGDGFGYAVRTPLVRATMVMTVFGNIGVSGVFGVALIVLSRNLSTSPVTLGILLAAVGVGGIVGGLGAGPLSQLRRRGPIVLIGWAFIAMLLAITPFFAGRAGRLPLTLPIPSTWELPIIAALLFVIGVIVALGDTMILTIFQQGIEPSYMSRVISVQFLMGGIAQPISLAAAGFLSAAFGPGVVFLAGGVLALGIVLVGFNAPAIRKL